MQGLAHNLSIRWMDGQEGKAEGGTEDVRGVEVALLKCVIGTGSPCLTHLSPNIEG